MFCPQCGTSHHQRRCPVCGEPSASQFESQGVSGAAYSSWWQRVGASVADSLIITTPLQALGLQNWALPVMALYLYLCWSSTGATIGNRLTGTRVIQESGADLGSRGALRRLFGWALIAQVPVSMFGTWALRYVVVDVSGSTLHLVLSPHYPVMVFVAAGVSLALSILDALWALRQPRRQTLHDLIARTVVVRRR